MGSGRGTTGGMCIGTTGRGIRVESNDPPRLTSGSIRKPRLFQRSQSLHSTVDIKIFCGHRSGDQAFDELSSQPFCLGIAQQTCGTEVGGASVRIANEVVIGFVYVKGTVATGGANGAAACVGGGSVVGAPPLPRVNGARGGWLGRLHRLCCGCGCGYDVMYIRMGMGGVAVGGGSGGGRR